MFIYPIYHHNWWNISTIYIYFKTSIKRNILTIKKKIHWEVGQAKNLPAPWVTTLWARQSRVQIMAEARDFFLLHNIQTKFGAQTAYYSMWIWVLFWQ